MRGFKGIPCLCCNNKDSVAVELCNTSVFHCSNCDESFFANDVQEFIDKWKPVLEWLATAPETSE